MKRYILITLFASLCAVGASADITVVDNQPMTPVSGREGWFEYRVTELDAGSGCTVIFNNGGWEGGQTADYAIASLQDACFTATAAGVVEQVECSATSVKGLDGDDGTRIFSREGILYGYGHGTLAVYTTAGKSVARVRVNGAFELPSAPGIYLVNLAGHSFKILIP